MDDNGRIQLSDYLEEINELKQVLVDYQLDSRSFFDNQDDTITITLIQNSDHDNYGSYPGEQAVYIIGATTHDLINFINGVRVTFAQFAKPDYEPVNDESKSTEENGPFWE